MRRISIAFAVFAFGVIAGLLIARAQPPEWNAAASDVSIRCLDPDQDLGPVWHTDAFELTFHLANQDPEHTFEIGSLRGGCACTTIEPEHVTLRPGEQATVRAVVDLEEALRLESLPKEYRETVVAVTRGKTGQEIVLRMTAKGMVQSSYTVRPESVSLGTVVRGDETAISAVVECLSPGPVVGLEVVSKPEWLTASVEPAGGKALRLRLAVTPGIPYGLLRERIRFRAVLASGPFVTRSMGVSAFVIDDLRAIPGSVLLAGMAVGRPRTVDITLQSQRGERFEVLEIRPTSAALRVTATGEPTGTMRRYVIAVTPASRGLMEEKVTFVLLTASGREHVMDVPVKGYVFGEGVLRLEAFG